MRRLSVVTAAHVAALAALLFAAAWTQGRALAWSTALLLLAAAAVAFNLYRLHTRLLNGIGALMRALPDAAGDRRANERRRGEASEHIAAEMEGMLHRFHDRLVADEARRTFYETLLDRVDTALLVCSPEGSIEWRNRAADSLPPELNRLPAEWLRPEAEGRTVAYAGAAGDTYEWLLTCAHMEMRGGGRRLLALKNVEPLLAHNEMEAWQKLIGVLTHEIMNSVAPIVSLADTLCLRAGSEKPDERAAALMLQAMQTIRRRGEGLLDFVENYRRLTRLPAPKPELIDVAELQADLARLFGTPALAFAPTEGPLAFRADRGQTEQLLINLIRNGLEACEGRERPRVEVRFTQCEAASMRIEVSDNGRGIPPDVAERVFIPFFTTKSKGSGIGLSLCKQIMALHRGRIRVSAAPGEGATFTLWFPGG